MLIVSFTLLGTIVALVRSVTLDTIQVTEKGRKLTVVGKPPTFTDPEYFANSKLSFSYYGDDQELTVRLRRMYLAWPDQSAWTGFGVAGNTGGMIGGYAVVIEPAGDGTGATFTERALRFEDGRPLFTGTPSLMRNSYSYDASTKTETFELAFPWRIGGTTISSDGKEEVTMLWALGRDGDNTIAEHRVSGTFSISKSLPCLALPCLLYCARLDFREAEKSVLLFVFLFIYIKT